MSARAVTLGCWIRFDAYANIGSVCGWLEIAFPSAGLAVRVYREFVSSTGAGALIIDYQWQVVVQLTTPEHTTTTLATIANPWRAFIGANENTIRYEQFQTHRLALAVQSSTYHADTGVHDADGTVAFYLDDVAVYSGSGLRVPDFSETERVVDIRVSVDEFTDRIWVRPTTTPTTTDSDGALVPLPSDLLLYDDVTDGALLAGWSARIPYGDAGFAGLPTSKPDMGGASGYGLSYAANATLTAIWLGTGPYTPRGLQRLVTLPAVVVPPDPPTAVPACAAPVFGGGSSGGVGCPAPVLP